MESEGAPQTKLIRRPASGARPPVRNKVSGVGILEHSMLHALRSSNSYVPYTPNALRPYTPFTPPIYTPLARVLFLLPARMHIPS